MEATGARAALYGVALLCAVGLGQRPSAVPSCGPGRLLRGIGNDARCCVSCASGKARAWSASLSAEDGVPSACAELTAAERRANFPSPEPSAPAQNPGSWTRSQLKPGWDQGRGVRKPPRDRSGVPTRRRAVQIPTEWVVSPWPSRRPLPAQFGIATALSAPPSASNLQLWVRGRWKVAVWGQLS